MAVIVLHTLSIVVASVSFSPLTPGSWWPRKVTWSKAGQCSACLAGEPRWGVRAIYVSPPPLRAVGPPAPMCPGRPETRGTRFPPDLRRPTWWAPATCGYLNFISCHTSHSSSSPQLHVASDTIGTVRYSVPVPQKAPRTVLLQSPVPGTQGGHCCPGARLLCRSSPPRAGL